MKYRGVLPAGVLAALLGTTVVAVPLSREIPNPAEVSLEAQGGAIRIERDVLLEILVSDALREALGLWRDRFHWRILVMDADAAASDRWEGFPSEAGKKTVAVFLDLPNGVNAEPYRVSYGTLESMAQGAVDGVLARHGWEPFYLSHAYYVRRAFGQ